MTSDWLVDYLRSLRRESPEDLGVERLLRLERRRVERRGSRSSPPTRTLDRARQQLLADRFLATEAGLSGEALPIDIEMRSLCSEGQIPNDQGFASEDGQERPAVEDVVWGGRLAIIDGCSWGDYYARYKLGREPNRKTLAKLLLEDGRQLQVMLEEFLHAHADVLISGRYAEQTKSLREQVDNLRGASQSLTDIVDAAKSAAADAGGNPGNPWRVGFVYGVSLRWVSLTTFRIADSDRFLSFVSQAAASIEAGPRQNSDTWSSAIRTAKAAFDLADDGRTWRRQPGDPPSTTEPTP